jgi:glycosyltransferase involved in cell wall biosynthesis
MHVAQFVHRYPPALGGAEAWTARLSHQLTAAGHRVTVFATTALDLSALTGRGHRELPPGTTNDGPVTVRRFRTDLRFPGRRLLLTAASVVPNHSWRAMVVPWAPVSVDLWRAAGRPPGDVGVVHALAFPYAAIIRAALRMARRLHVPFVVTPFLHLGDPGDPRDPIRRAYTAPHLRWLLRQADRVLVQTPTEQAAVHQMGIADNRIVPQGLGVDAAECTGGDRAAARARWGATSREFVLGHLANLSAEKGTPDLVRAMDMVSRLGFPVRLVIAGPSMPSYQRFRDRFGKPSWLQEAGPLSDSERREFFAGIDAFALPSRSDSFGLVLLEAWANRQAVIGYRAGGVADVIRDEVDGLLVPCGDIRALAEAIRRMFVEPGLRQQWGAAGNARLEREFCWSDKLQIAERALTNWT